MLNKLLGTIRRYNMVQPGDTVICAVSGGADSMALLWAMYLLRDKLKIHLEAAHFNHKLRADESERDAAFVKSFCDGYKIPLHMSCGNVLSGKKGLEAAARDARYGFFATLSGKIATAHTADDNAETLLMHMLRGTGLKGLGGITPIRGNIIRPMLAVTREDVCAFLQEYCLSYVSDSSNETDQFLRNRLRHHVMPVLYRENPKVNQNLSAMAMRLREDAVALDAIAISSKTLEVPKLQQMLPAIRSRVLTMILQDFGVKEPDAEHIALLESLVYSKRPSATADFPGNVTVGRNYDFLEKKEKNTITAVNLPRNGMLKLEDWGLVIKTQTCDFSDASQNAVLLQPIGALVLRSREAGDSIRLPAGTKSLKKLYIDRKIPALERASVPVIADNAGVLYIHGIGPNLARKPEDGEVVCLWIQSL